MATIKDKIGLAMLPSAQSGGASADTTDFSGTVHSLLPIQHETPDLVDIIPNTTDVNTGGVYTDVTWISDHDFGIGDLLKVTFTLKGLSSTTRAWGYNEFYPKDNVTEYTDGTYTAYWDVISSASITRTFRFYQASSPRTGTISIDRVVRVVNGDFKFERSSSATRVGSDGYIKNVEVLSDELVQNGDFEEVGSELITYSDFNYGSGGWSLVNGKWVFDDVTAGYLNYTSTSVTVGQIYKVVVDVSVLSGVANFRFTSGNAQTVLFNYTDFSDGVTTFYTTVTGVNGNLQRLYAATTLSDAFTLNSISIKEVGQNWTFNTGWSINNGYAFTDGTVNQPLEQINVATIGKKYRISLDVTRLSTGNIDGRVWFGTSNPVYNFNDEGSYLFELEANATNLRINTLSGNVASWSVDNVSVVEITDDTDIPRLDFSNAAQPSLLLEPGRTNTAFENGNFVLSAASTTYNYGISPSGKKDSIKLESTATGGSHIRTSPLTTLGTQACSVFVKKGVGDYVQLLQAGDGNHFANFDLTNGTVTLEGLTTNASVEVYGDWLRLIAVFDNVTSTAGNFRLYLSDSATAGFGGAPSALGNYLEFWGFQVEIGNYATSYINNTIPSTTVTRSADVCNNAGDSTIFNDAEGVLFAEVSSLDGDTSSNREISLSDGTTGNSVRIYYAINYENRITPRVDVGGSTVWVGSVDATTKHIKVALRYSSAGMDFYVNGFKELTTTTVPNFTNSLRSLQIRRGDGNTGSDFYGNVRQLLYFNEALTDAELERLTSSDITQVLRNYNRRGELLGATYESTHVQTKLNELF